MLKPGGQSSYRLAVPHLTGSVKCQSPTAPDGVQLVQFGSLPSVRLHRSAVRRTRVDRDFVETKRLDTSTLVSNVDNYHIFCQNFEHLSHHVSHYVSTWGSIQ